MSSNAFDLSGVRVVRSGRTILDVDSLSIPAGGAAAILGSNGAGKTTLLHVLALLLEPGEGKFSFFGRELFPGTGASASDRKRVTLVMQSPWMFRGSVLHNAAYGPRARGATRAEAARIGMEALERLGLKDFAGRPARTLSGGEARRLAVARALAAEPDVLLLDEPTADVDEQNRSLIEAAVVQVNREKGVTVVFSSHERDQAPRMSAVAHRLECGRLTAAGGPAGSGTGPSPQEK